ncbi:MAG: RNA polymerase sigma factor [Lachnospira sp.]|nr:RNA polymerase sigma factor [Lachnospira sp.]
MEMTGMRTTKQSLVRQWAEQMLETDAYLIDRIVNDNDRLAAETLLERHYKTVYKVIYIKVSDKELAMDLTQDTFILVLRSLSQYDSGKASFKTWITRIAENKVIDYLRSRQHKESLLTEVMGDDETATGNIDDVVINKVAGDEIKKFLGRVEEETRKIFVMKAREGYTFSEISERLGMPVSTVKSKYYALIKDLRKEMQGYE